MGNKFKIGDEVKRINYKHTNYNIGDIGIVTFIGHNYIKLDDNTDQHDFENLELVQAKEEVYEIY